MPKAPVLYEAMYIVPVEMSEEEIAGLEARLRACLEGAGARVEATHEFARRRLAFPVLGHTEGIYRIMYFHGDGATVEEIKHEMSLSEEIIRGSVVVANPKYMIGQQLPQEPAEPAEAEPTEAEEPEQAPEPDETQDTGPQQEPAAVPAGGAAEDQPTPRQPGGDETPETQQ